MEPVSNTLRISGYGQTPVIAAVGRFVERNIPACAATSTTAAPARRCRPGRTALLLRRYSISLRHHRGVENFGIA